MAQGRPRKLTDGQRKLHKAMEQRKRRASEKGKLWTKEYYQRPEVKKQKSLNSKTPKNRLAIRRWELKKEFGITLEQYDEMFMYQRGLCLICDKPDSSGKRLSVDHCHSSGKVRGLLCGNCNRALGLFYDNVESLGKAIKYLKNGK